MQLGCRHPPPAGTCKGGVERRVEAKMEAQMAGVEQKKGTALCLVSGAKVEAQRCVRQCFFPCHYKIDG
eukprot:scaffold306069_cov19-Tisochrysis_lutea.AAC.1